MASTTVSQFKQQFLATATSLKLSSGYLLELKSYWDNDTLNDLTKLVCVFGVSSSHLHLTKVGDSSWEHYHSTTGVCMDTASV